MNQTTNRADAFDDSVAAFDNIVSRVDDLLTLESRERSSTTVDSFDSFVVSRHSNLANNSNTNSITNNASINPRTSTFKAKYSKDEFTKKSTATMVVAKKKPTTAATTITNVVTTTPVAVVTTTRTTAVPSSSSSSSEDRIASLLSCFNNWNNKDKDKDSDKNKDTAGTTETASTTNCTCNTDLERLAVEETGQLLQDIWDSMFQTTADISLQLMSYGCSVMQTTDATTRQHIQTTIFKNKNEGEPFHPVVCTTTDEIELFILDHQRMLLNVIYNNNDSTSTSTNENGGTTQSNTTTDNKNTVDDVDCNNSATPTTSTSTTEPSQNTESNIDEIFAPWEPPPTESYSMLSEA